MQASKRNKVTADKAGAKTRHCEECQYRIWSEEYANTPKHLQCGKGHAPRFFMPQSPIDQDWGWKRKCHDYADFQSALWTIVKLLGGNEAAELLDREPQTAYEKYAKERHAA